MIVTFFILSFVIVLCVAQTKQMSFFVTSKPYAGGNLGGLAGADAKCTALATAVGEHTGRTWKAYLSSSKEDARDRIGSGPWYNQKLVEIASNINNLHSNNGMNQQLGKANTLDEKGNRLNGKGDSPNRHDVLTGSSQAGRKIEDLNCKDWTSTGNGGANRAQVGHHDKDGGGANPKSWNSAHPSRGCTIDQLRASGGDGRFYCFAIPTAAPTTTTPKPTTTTAKPTTTTAKAPAPTQTPKNTPPPTSTAAGTCNAGSCADCINSSTGADRCKWCPVDGKGCMAYTDACGGSIRSADQCSAAPTTTPATPPIDDPNNCGAQTANGCTACVQAAGGEDSEDDSNRCKWCPVGTAACIPYGAQCGGSQRTKAQCEAGGAPPSTSGSSARCGDASLHLNKCSACLVIDGSEPGSLCNWCHGTKTCAAKGDPNCIRPLSSFIECGSVTDAPRIATAAPTPLGGLTDSVNSDASRVFGLTCIASLCLLLSLLF